MAYCFRFYKGEEAQKLNALDEKAAAFFGVPVEARFYACPNNYWLSWFDFLEPFVRCKGSGNHSMQELCEWYTKEWEDISSIPSRKEINPYFYLALFHEWGKEGLTISNFWD